MSTREWVGTAFAAATVIFFIVAYFIPSRSPQQDKILRLLGTISAGASAASFISGQIETSVGTKGEGLAVSAAGAVAFAVAVWFGWGTVITNTPGFNANFPNNATFRQALELIARHAGGSVIMTGFTQEEENAVLQFNHLEAKSPADAMRRLANLVQRGVVGSYRVSEEAKHFEVVKN
jgi:hypothetical protein